MMLVMFEIIFDYDRELSINANILVLLCKQGADYSSIKVALCSLMAQLQNSLISAFECSDQNLLLSHIAATAALFPK